MNNTGGLAYEAAYRRAVLVLVVVLAWLGASWALVYEGMRAAEAAPAKDELP